LPSSQPLPTGETLTSGTVVAGRFRVEARLGEGGMAVVYQVFDLPTQRHLALKVLKRDLSAIPEAASRFRREGELLVRLDHPGIVRIETFGTTETGELFLAMELLTGETLGARLKRLGRMEPHDLAPVVAGVCSALAFAHGRGVIHRDLKPENVFLARRPSGEERVKVLDFGISKVFGAERLTQTGELLGTPRYMAPEQLAADHDLDARVDVYALGVMLYECLTGMAPFSGRAPSDLIVAILHGRAVPLRSVRPDVAPEVEGVVARAMAKAREARFATPEEFANAFLAAIGRTSGPEPLRAGAATVALGSMAAEVTPSPALVGALPMPAVPRAGAATIVVAPSPTDAVRPGTFSALPLHAARADVAPATPSEAMRGPSAPAAFRVPTPPARAVAVPAPGPALDGSLARAASPTPSGALLPPGAHAPPPTSPARVDAAPRYSTPSEPLPALPITQAPRIALVFLALIAGAVSAGAAVVAAKWLRGRGAAPSATPVAAPPAEPGAELPWPSPPKTDVASTRAVPTNPPGPEVGPPPLGGDGPADRRPAVGGASQQRAGEASSHGAAPTRRDASTGRTRRDRAVTNVGGAPEAGDSASPAVPSTSPAVPSAAPSTVSELLASARAALSRRDFAGCVALVDRALTAGAPAIALRIKGDCLAGAGETHQALAAYRRFCVVASDHPAFGETRARAEALGGSCP
jgi:serine/threonine-protein kinase